MVLIGKYFQLSDEWLQILETRDNHDVYTIYVTDYTVNKFLPVVEAAWSPPSLANRVLRMDCMYDAAVYAKENMQKGNYFLLPNARMKRDTIGVWEATISEAHKFRKLDVDELEKPESVHLPPLLK